MKKILSILSFVLLLAGCSNPNNSSSFDSQESSFYSMKNEEDININIKETLDYSIHPLSEPDVNKQLVTFNPLGNLKDVWNYYRGDNVTVAVIDSGFDYDHPEFISKDGRSKVSEKSAYIYTNASKQVKVEVGKEKVDITDGDSHGTMCAGLLASSVNGTGISGIAPNVNLMLIKIDKKALSMAQAFRYAADNGARVISTSLGAYPNVNGENSGDIHFEKGLDLSKVFNDSINYAYSKGVSIVAATGNSKETRVSYPAGCENVIGAGGLASGSMTKIWDNGYEGSNYNGCNVYVDVFAPSEGIYAPGFDVSKSKPTYWGDAKGTSFASPLIAGAIALYYQKYPNATNKDVEKALESSCADISSFNNNKNMGWGRLDVFKLLNLQEDIVLEEINPSSTIVQKGTKLTIYDEEGWDFRTLHLFNLEFAPNYGYKEFERYLDYVYKERISTQSYNLEGTKKCYAYTDEGYVGDYYLCNGNTDHAKATTYEYIFPWWVYKASYQIVNNSNWLPENGGNTFSYSSGYGKAINAYFWYDSPTSFDVTQVVGDSYTASFPSIKIVKKLYHNHELISTEEVNHSVYDYYEVSSENPKDNLEFKGWFVDKSYTYLYQRKLFGNDSEIYGIVM